METRFVTFENTRLALHMAGRGPIALLVHGYPLDHRMWLDLVNGPLAERRTLIALDLRGHGHSPWCGDPTHTMELFADDIAVVLRTITDDPVDLVALSMGGYAALAVMERHAQLVRSLTLVDTKARGDDEAGRAGRDAAIRTVSEKGRSTIANAMSAKLLAPRPESDPHGQLLRARLQTMIEAQATETIVADLRGMRDRPDRSAVLASIAVPTLVVVGEHDALTPPVEARAIAAAIPDARCVVVPGCGHLTPMENPIAFAQALGGFWGAEPPA